MDDSAVRQVERQRKTLEANVAQLRKALQHWQTCELEYEGLREEIASLPEGCSSENILAIARDFRAELVDEKELQKLLRTDKGDARNQAQIIDLLEKRVGYVARNARTIEKQLSDAQKKRNALLLAEDPNHRDEAGLPLTDITEELDDAGNVVSSKVETSKSATPRLVDVLHRAGVKDILEQDGVITSSDRSQQESEEGSNSHHKPNSASGLSDDPNRSSTEDQEPAMLDDEELDQVSSALPISTSLAQSAVKTSATAATGKFGPTIPVADDESESEVEEIDRSNPNDNPEEAALRHEMLRYGMDEVGAIVAELELEESGSDAESDDDADFSMEDEFEDIQDDDDSEDENGMVKHPTMTTKYLEKMKQLEEKYKVQGMKIMGPDTSNLPSDVQAQLDRPSAAEAARKAAPSRAAKADADSETSSKKSKVSLRPKKKVAFAEELDIAPQTKPKDAAKSRLKTRPEALTIADPIKDTIVERSPTASTTQNDQLPPSTQNKKSSRFKTIRDLTPQTPLYPPPFDASSHKPPPEYAASPPVDQIQSQSVIERMPTTHPTPPQASDDLDATVHRREIASEFYEMRNRMIQRQDGFVGGGEEDNYGDESGPLFYRDEDGNERKVSRFRAARLR